MPGKEQVYLLAEQVERLRASLQAADPYLLAARTGTIYHPTEQENGEFRFQLWGQEVKLAFPAFQGLDPMTGMEIPTHLQALLLYYFTTCDGVPPGGRWISFSELPNGRFYNQASRATPD